MSSSVRLKVLGCGDAFGSGGVPNTCFFLEHEGHGLLIDCGATSLVQLKKYGLSSRDLDRILISHFHGDHYGGIPFILLEAALVQKRERPLSIIGPEGLRDKLPTLQDALYPGTSDHMDELDLRISSYRNRSVLEFEDLSVRTWPVIHAAGSNPHALRLEIGGRVIAFSGDTAWTDALYEVAEGADLFICECNFLEQEAPGHIHYQELKEKAPHIGAERMVLTHRGPTMLERSSEIDHECLVEGQEIEL
jgi:ribonuclease BN (tRNA processing enzyme)